MARQLSEASKTKLSQLIATINQWPEFETNNYLEDHPDRAREVALTLKHYANPLADYPVDKEFETDMQAVLIALADPTKLKPNFPLVLTEHEEEALRDLLRIKLDQLANEIIINHKLNINDMQPVRVELDNAAPVENPAQGFTPEERWWNGLTKQQKQQIRARHNGLNEDQNAHLQDRMQFVYPEYREHAAPRNTRRERNLRYYQMSLIDAELDYLKFRVMLDLTELGIRLLAYSGRAAYYIGAGIAQNPTLFNTRNAYREGDDSKGFAGIIVIIAFAVASIAACCYGIKKAYNSIINLIEQKKPLRSVFRLVGIVAGAFAGEFGGAILGATLGSIIPGLGTAAGAALGVIFGICLGMGVGAFITKYIAKLISYIKYHDEDVLNPTNPDKWRLSTSQMNDFMARGVNLNAVNDEIVRIKQEKDQIGVSGSFFWTDARKEKDRLNQKLEQLKNGDAIFRQYPVRYGFFMPAQNAPAMQAETVIPRRAVT